MSESCTEFAHTHMHALKSRNLGSIHPTSRPGDRPRGLQEVFVHAAQGTGKSDNRPPTFSAPHS
eukprot:3470222-Alexandrium_andersonii.AAC.1